MNKLIIANWKANPVMANEAESLFRAIEAGIKNIKNTDIVVCPPAIFLPHLEQIKSKKIILGSQNILWQDKGAYTGEISGLMMKQFDCRYSIIGHSERKRYFCESDEIINLKVGAAIKIGWKVVLCVGEKNRGNAEKEIDQILEDQIRKALKGAGKNRLSDIAIAYEPVWAVGTGLTVTPDDALKARLFIRKLLTNIYDRVSAEKAHILYGGSVNSENAAGFASIMDGALVGGASIDAEEFIKIVKIFSTTESA